jgi:tetratricopeptide (TPR) repeat protein
VAAVAEERGNLVTALEFIQASIAIKRELSAQNPGDASLKSGLANSLGWAGRMLETSGDRSGALAVLQEAEAVIGDLIAKDPGNSNHQELMSVTLHLTAAIHRDLGQAEAAIRSFRADLAIISKLVERDPENATWRGGLAVTKRTLGLQLLWLGRVEEAEPLIRDAEVLVRDLLVLDPVNAEHRLELAYSRLVLARLELVLDEPVRALEWLNTSVTEIAFASNPEPDARTRQYFGETLLLRGEVHSLLGHPGRATSDWAMSREVLTPLEATSADAGFLLAWSHLMALTGKREESLAAASRLAAQDFARADFLAMCREQNLVFD